MYSNFKRTKQLLDPDPRHPNSNALFRARWIPFQKFHKSTSQLFWLILLTDRQTDKGKNITMLAELTTIPCMSCNALLQRTAGVMNKSRIEVYSKSAACSLAFTRTVDTLHDSGAVNKQLIITQQRNHTKHGEWRAVN